LLHFKMINVSFDRMTVCFVEFWGKQFKEGVHIEK